MGYVRKLVGEKVYLSPMQLADAELYVKWMNHMPMAENLGTPTKTIGIENELSWIRNNESKNQFAIIKVANDELIGNCGFHNMNHISQSAELGLFIGEKKDRNKGYGSEVIELLLNYGFDYLNLHSIMLSVYAFNERAIHCYEKIGFKEIGRRREAYYCRNQFHDVIFMDILKDEWNRKRKCKDVLCGNI